MFKPGSGKFAVFIGSMLLGLSFCSPAPLLAAAGDIIWSYQTGYQIHQSSPAVASDGTIYVGSLDNKLYAINPSDGSQKWAFPTGHNIESSPAIGSDGTVYVGSDDGKLYAVNPADGTQKWAFAIGGVVWSSPAIGSDGTIYVGSEDGKLYAVNPADGTQKWAFATGGQAFSSPAIGSDGTIYVGSMLGPLYAINPNGSEKWAFATGGIAFSSPAIGSDGTIYVGSGDDSLYAINPNGTRKWAFPTGNKIESSPAIGSDGTVYVGSADGKLYAVNPADGTRKWAFPTGGNITSSPAIGSDGTVYVGSSDDSLHAINPDSTRKWAFPTGGIISSSPAIGSDGTLYIGSFDYRLYAIDTGTGAGLADSPWPKFRHNLLNTGQTGPEIGLSATSVSIAGVDVGSSASNSFTITNAGVLDLVVSSITSDNALFTLSPSSATISPGANQTVTVTFSPTAPGAESATITVNSNDADEPTLTVSASGTGTVAPEISLSTTSLSIAGVDPGSSADASFTITNEGTAELNVSSIASDNARFRLNPTSATIAPGAGQQITVTYHCGSVASQSATITVNSDDPDEGKLTVSASGTAKPAPEIKVLPYCKTFGTENTVGSSKSLEFSLKNTGTLELVISNITCSNPAFAISPTAATLSAGAARAFTITFSPTAVGEYSTTVKVSSNAWNGAVLDFLGGAVSGPEIAISAPSPFYLGSVALGLSLSKSFTIHNPGSETLVVSRIACEEGPFSVTPGSADIAPGSSLEVTVTFTPTVASAAIQHGYIAIASNDSDEASLSLHVAGAGRDAPIMVLGTSLLDFGEVYAGSSMQKTLEVFNAGTVELILSGISVKQGTVFSVSPEAATVGPGQSVQLSVTFAPPAAGSYQDVLVISGDDTPAEVALAGEGTPPPVFFGATGDETFQNNTGSYDLWVKLSDQLTEPTVKIIISQDGGITFPDTMDCTCDEEGKFTVPVPARELGTCLHYYFEVTDSSGKIYRDPEAAPEECFILDVSLTKKGDANGDWVTDANDLILLLQILSGSSDPSPLADLNGDGKVNVFDLLELLKML